MKVMFASDIRGSVYYCRKTLGIYNGSRAGQLVILGGLLYHGPRNDLPREYAPREVITMLNPPRNQIYAIRRNCDAEVDQMILEFLILTDYDLLVLEGKVLYVAHGRIYNQDRLPPLWDRDILTHGHTHILRAETTEMEEGRHTTVLSPGPVSIPKGGNPSTYTVLENGVFSIRALEGEVVKELKL